MLQIVRRGSYRLIETKKQTKILILDEKDTFAWINAIDIGEMLVSSHKKHTADCILANGVYRLYNVKNESNLTDVLHLELSVGRGTWQGYLLPTGLAIDEKKRNRIIPTGEVITKKNINQD